MEGALASAAKSDFSKTCAFCHVAAQMYCARCGDSYCSPTCQRSDWMRHRYFCLPMANLMLVDNAQVNVKVENTSEQAVGVGGTHHLQQIPETKDSLVEEKSSPSLSKENDSAEKMKSESENCKLDKKEKETASDLNDPIKGASPKKVMEVEKKVKPPFEVVGFQVGAKNLEVIVLDNMNLKFGYFGAIPSKDYGNLTEVQNYLGKLEDNGNKAYYPELNEYCLAKYEGEYYRAQVIVMPSGESNNLYTVIYIDYGNEGSVYPTDIRKYPEDLRIPCSSQLCIIKGLDDVELGEKFLNNLKKYVAVDKKLKIDMVHSRIEIIAVVDLSTTVNKMKLEGITSFSV